MLAAIDPGYDALEVASRLDSHLCNGTLHFVQYNADSPSGAGYAEALADLFYDAPPVKEFRKRYTLTRVGGRKHLLAALLKAYKQYGGQDKPNIAILEFRAPYKRRAQRVRNLPRRLPAGRLSGRNRLARSTGIP